MSPVAQPQPQPHSYRSNSEVVAKKNRKQAAAAGVMPSKNKKREPQAQNKIAELAKKLRNNDSAEHEADERGMCPTF